ncbi:hypothetical protein PAPHI01_1727 [Pancytospora philotis]|nr:hypothetical protein PAPHI01_1727 [Pancytospora philotis]
MPTVKTFVIAAVAAAVILVAALSRSLQYARNSTGTQVYKSGLAFQRHRRDYATDLPGQPKGPPRTLPSHEAACEVLVHILEMLLALAPSSEEKYWEACWDFRDELVRMPQFDYILKCDDGEAVSRLGPLDSFEELWERPAVRAIQRYFASGRFADIFTFVRTVSQKYRKCDLVEHLESGIGTVIDKKALHTITRLTLLYSTLFSTRRDDCCDWKLDRLQLSDFETLLLEGSTLVDDYMYYSRPKDLSAEQALDAFAAACAEDPSTTELRSVAEAEAFCNRVQAIENHMSVCVFAEHCDQRNSLPTGAHTCIEGCSARSIRNAVGVCAGSAYTAGEICAALSLRHKLLKTLVYHALRRYKQGRGQKAQKRLAFSTE